MDLKFSGNVRKAGNSYVVTIPPAIVNLLDDDKEYEFIISEA